MANDPAWDQMPSIARRLAGSMIAGGAGVLSPVIGPIYATGGLAVYGARQIELKATGQFMAQIGSTPLGLYLAHVGLTDGGGFVKVAAVMGPICAIIGFIAPDAFVDALYDSFPALKDANETVEKVPE